MQLSCGWLVDRDSPAPDRRDRSTAIFQEMGSLSHRYWHTSVFPSIIAYVVLSCTTSYLNRSLFHGFFFDYGVALLIAQMAMGLLVLEVSRFLNWISIPPYTIERGKSMMVPSLLYFCSCYVSIGMLNGFDTPLYNILKRCVPFAVLALTTSLSKPDRSLFSAVGVVTIGLVMTGYQGADFDVYSLAYGILVLALQSSYLIFIERTAATGQYTIMDMIYLNTFNGLVFSLLVDLVVDESRDAITYFMTSSTFLFWITLFCSLVAGILLQWALFYCVIRNSALTTSIVGGVKSVFESCMARTVLLGASGLCLVNWMGLILSGLGCAMYAISVRNRSIDCEAFGNL